MRILVLGAGGIGGYFGARLHDAGSDVTFLVRPARAAQLRASSLHVSPHGDTAIVLKLVTRDELAERGERYDVIVLSCKAYDLASAIEAWRRRSARRASSCRCSTAYVTSKRWSNAGEQRAQAVPAFISVVLEASGAIRHLNALHRIVIGARTPQSEPAPALLEPLAQALASARCEFILSENIEQTMWDKFVFLATLAAATCTLRASVGDIVRTLAVKISSADCSAVEAARVAAACGHTVGEAQLAARIPGSSPNPGRD